MTEALNTEYRIGLSSKLRGCLTIVVMCLALSACKFTPIVANEWAGDELPDLGNTSTVGVEDPYDYINLLRTNAGMIEVTQNSFLVASAVNHAEYLSLNNGIIQHEETLGMPGYTGVHAGDRAVSVGYSTYNVGEGIANSRTQTGAMDNLMSAIYHRFTLFNVTYDEIGIHYVSPQATSLDILVHNMGNSRVNQVCQTESAISSGSYYPDICSPKFNISATVVDGAVNEIAQLNPEMIVWPQQNAVDIPPAFYEETPDPLPNHSVSGNPISVQFNPAKVQNASITAFHLYDESTYSYVLSTHLMDATNDPNGNFSELDFALFPLERLEWGRRYRVELEYQQDGVEKSVMWRFTTRVLDGPVYRLTSKQNDVTISKSGKSFIYFVPKDGTDIMSQFDTAHLSNIDVTVDYVDYNTLSIDVLGNAGDEITVVLNGSRTINVTLQ
ncbi:MAG: CAP domain-containing protein [Gammaproteobacteria bacterium]|nr:CAP domain-containing protein [Gammaproteobacteria bacterium]